MGRRSATPDERPPPAPDPDLPRGAGEPGAGSIIGVDESGKGDYFGPLVVVGVCIPETARAAVAALGVRDSKTVSDAQARRLAATLREAYPTAIVAIGPERYNTLYTKMRNLNRLLAWAHARAIEDILERMPGCRQAISDQFADAAVLERALLERGRQITLRQQPRAEADPIVAAASLIARGEFLRRLQALGERFGMTLPKGAGPPVLAAGAAFVRRHGAADLAQVAKLHFRTTRQLTGGASA